MAETYFPARKRCKACRRALGSTPADPVLKGQFCTASCAGMAAPAATPETAPRECKTQRDGQWVFKRRYRSVDEIPDKITSDPSSGHYDCGHCGHIHIGHTRMGTVEAQRVMRGPDDLADILIKRRGKASHAEVAKAAGVRPIRLKELETGVKHPDGNEVMFKVAKVLRIDLSAGFR